MRGVAFSLRPEAVKRGGAGVQGIIPQIGFDGPETEDVDPAVEASYDRYDEDRVHVVRMWDWNQDENAQSQRLN
jgi:hypothetical protein